MSQSQQHTHKWKVPLSVRVLEIMGKCKKKSPTIIAKILGSQQSAVSMCMINLERNGLLYRKACICGRGFVYWK